MSAASASVLLACYNETGQSLLVQRPQMQNDPLLKWRERFPILQECTYLVSHSLGAMPDTVRDYLSEYADTWATRGVRAWGERWWGLNGEAGDKIGRIIGAAAGTVSMHQNASLALSVLLSALDWSDERRNRVVVTDMIFPTDYYVLREMLPPHVEIVMVKSPDGIRIDTDELLAAIDEQTRLVLVDHVLFRSSYIMPLAEIVQRAQQVGAQVLADGYHSAGIIPVDVRAAGVDFYVGGVLKWMCGGPGGVYLYVRPDLMETLRPRITGWFAHERPFDFEVERIVWRKDAYRLLNGTFGVASLYSIQAGVDVIAEVGVAAIREQNKKLTALLFELCDAAGFVLKSPRDPEQRGGMVVVEPPQAYAVSRELLEREIVIDYRENAGIRIAPHFYNTADEVRQVVAAMQDILDSGVWQRHADKRDFIT